MTSDSCIARIARSDRERDAAFKLRYSVYFEEQGKAYPEADHIGKKLTDPLDAGSEILIIFNTDGEPVGTVRSSWMDDQPAFEHYKNILDLKRFDHFRRGEISVCSRLAVSRESRNMRICASLFSTNLRRGLDRQTKLCFAMCAPRLLPLFKRYGFREYENTVMDPLVGPLHRTVLHLDDRDYLRSIKSPFIQVIDNVQTAA